MTVSNKLTVEAVKAWAEQLPTANMPVAARETYEMLGKLETSGMAARQRLQVLEIMQRPAMLVLKHIRQRVASDDAQAAQLLPLGDAFCERMTKACEALLESPEKHGMLGFRKSVSEQALAFNAEYMEQWYALRTVSRRTVADGFWSMFKYHVGLSGDRLAAPVARILALQLAAPAGMTTRQLQSVVEFLAGLPMAELVTVAEADSQVGGDGFFWCDGVGAPQYGSIPAGSKVIDLSRFVARASAVTSIDFDPLLMADLLQRWRGEWPEKQGRRTTERPVVTSVVVGLRGVVRHLGEALPGRAAASGFAMESVELSATGDSFVNANNPFAQLSKAAPASFVDLSMGGCRLRTRWESVQAGDIIAVQWGKMDWRIGSISWVVRERDEWDCGIHWLMDDAKPATVSFDSGEPVVGLIGTSLGDGQQGLVYASGVHAGELNCRVNTGSPDRWQTYSLVSRTVTGVAEMALIEVPTPLSVVGAENRVAAAPLSGQPPAQQLGGWGSFAAMVAVGGDSAG